MILNNVSKQFLLNTDTITALENDLVSWYINSNADPGNGTRAYPLDSASVAVSAARHGTQIFFKYGSSRLREEVDLSAYSNCIVGGYGESSNGFAEVSGMDIITGTWDDSGDRGDANSNTYSISITHDAPSGRSRHLRMLEDEARLTEYYTIADVDSNAGSYMAEAGSTSPTTVYVHPKNSTNPNTDGKTYEVAVRAYVFRSVDISNVIGRGAVHNDGVVVNGDTTHTMAQVLAAWGSVHTIAIQEGTAVDCIAYDGQVTSTTGSTTLWVAYKTSWGSTESLTLTRCMALQERRPTDDYVSGFYTHAGDSTYLPELVMDACVFSNVYLSGDADSVTIRNCYHYNPVNFGVVDSNGSVAQIQRCIYRHNASAGSLGFGVLGSDVTFTDCVFASDVSGGFSVAFLRYSSGTKTFTQCVFYSPNQARPLYDITDATLDLTYAIIWNASDKGPEVGGTSYTGDYNVFYDNGGDEMSAKYNGTGYTDLSSWQTATGQDANSVYLTDAQAADFWLNDPATGDFRINPNAEVTAANGTTYTGQFPDGTDITEAGPQNYYDYNTRTVKSGPPQKYPTIPDSFSEAKQYVQAPESWQF
jgi:hypothetical protein